MCNRPNPPQRETVVQTTGPWVPRPAARVSPRRCARLGLWLLMFSLAYNCARIRVQAAEAVRMAVVAIEPSLREASDLLMMELTKTAGVSMLERSEIEKVYREQALASANRDGIKLGQVLGADGLILLEFAGTGANVALSSRLVAVKTGLILGGRRTGWPLARPQEWAADAAKGLTPLLPKLAVPPKDAVPISVAGVKSALPSRRAERLEEDLAVLLVDRLSQERNIFVLERQRMDLMGAEKDLNASGQSAFWEGQYVLEGELDRNGQAETTVTLDARFVPPNGGTPLMFHVVGARTNVPGIANDLALEVAKSLRLEGQVTRWDPAREAARFHEEAKWALRWGQLANARKAADTAWILGKHDMACAIDRLSIYIRSVLDVAPSDLGGFQRSTHSFGTGTEEGMRKELGGLKAARENGTCSLVGINQIEYAKCAKRTHPIEVELALRMLNLHREMREALPGTDPQSESAWDSLVWQEVTASARVLQHYHAFPKDRRANQQTLTELRSATRALADATLAKPALRNGYWPQDTPARPGVPRPPLHPETTTFECVATWGCFWQDTPADCVRMYRALLGSPAFSQFHGALRFREPQAPRIAIWQDQDETTAAEAWGAFVTELINSTNVYQRIEGLAFRVLDDKDPAAMEPGVMELWSTILAGREALLAEPINVMAVGWSLSEIFGSANSLQGNSETYEQLEEQYRGTFRAAFDAMRDEHGQRRRPGVPVALNRTGPAPAPAPTPTPVRKVAPRPANPSPRNEGPPWLEGPPGSGRSRMPQTTEPQPTNALLVTDFVAMPKEVIPNARARRETWIGAGFWKDNALWLGLHDLWHPTRTRGHPVLWEPSAGKWRTFALPKDRFSVTYETHGDALYILMKWMEKMDQNEPLPGGSDSNPEQFGAEPRAAGAYRVASEAEIQRQDLATGATTLLALGSQRLTGLFSVNGKLYAAGSNTVFEVVDDGRESRILASGARRPAASALDELPTFGNPVLFQWSEHALGILIGNTVYAWDDHDWAKVWGIPFRPAADRRPGGMVFRTTMANRHQLWCLPSGSPAAEFCLGDDGSPRLGASTSGRTRQPGVLPTPPEDRKRLPLTTADAVEFVGRDIYVLCGVTPGPEWPRFRPTPPEFDAGTAKLFVLRREDPGLVEIPLRFALDHAVISDAGMEMRSGHEGTGARWWLAAGPDHVFLGMPDLEGFWRIPRKQLDKAIAEAKQTRPGPGTRQPPGRQTP